MSLLKLKSIFSPTNTKFQDTQSDLTTLDSKFDDGLNVPTSEFKRYGETFESQFNFDTLFDNGLNTPTSEFKRYGQRFESQFDFNTIFDDGLGLPIFTNIIQNFEKSTFLTDFSSERRIEEIRSTYQSNQPIDKFDTKLNYNEDIFHENSFTFSTDLTQRGGRDNPLLDSPLRGRVYQPIRFTQDFQNDNLFVKPEVGELVDPMFRTQLFDPRAPFAKEGTLYFNTNSSFNNPTNPTDFSTAGGNNNSSYTPLSGFENYGLNELGGQFKENLSWENLYESNHQPKPSPTYKGVEAVNYGPNVSRNKLSINSNQTTYGEKSGFRGFDRKSEPYIVSSIGERDKYFNRLENDVSRLSKFLLESPQGLAFIARTNLNGENSRTIYFSKQGKLKQTGQRFKQRYNPLSTLLSAGARAGFHSIANLDKTEPGLDSLFGSNEYGNVHTVPGTGKIISATVPYDVNKSFTDGRTGGGFGFAKTLINTLTFQSGRDITLKPDSSGGDDYTLAKMFTAESLNPTSIVTMGKDTGVYPANPVLNFNIDTTETGMPFYFKDLRDNTYIMFRAYIEGLTENVTPSYAVHNYIGRSEPVYTYERGEREISMTLKLVAQTKDELKAIYAKMDRLTSLCYPQYTSDDSNYSDPYGNRMKPPLTKLRYGELYGKTNEELMGYIKSISYSIDQSSTYETGYPAPKGSTDLVSVSSAGAQKKEGRVPRHILATISYQVIHSKAPRLSSDFDFYGYVGNKEKTSLLPGIN